MFSCPKCCARTESHGPIPYPGSQQVAEKERKRVRGDNSWAKGLTLSCFVTGVTVVFQLHDTSPRGSVHSRSRVVSYPVPK